MNIDENDVLISYLPYAHVFEQSVFVVTMSKGASHGYYSGNPLMLFDDM